MLTQRPIFQTMRVAPLVRPSGPPRLWKVIPPFRAPREVGVDDHHRGPRVLAAKSRRRRSVQFSENPSQVPLLDHRRNWDPMLVHGPYCSSKYLH